MCDESSLTGESVAVEKSAEEVLSLQTPLAERVNMAYSGSLVTRGKAIGVVEKIGKKQKEKNSLLPQELPVRFPENRRNCR